MQLTHIEQITNEAAFFERLILSPADKAVSFYAKNNFIETESFYDNLKPLLDNFLAPRKKFKSFLNTSQILGAATSLLTSRDKLDKDLRPTLTKIFFNSEDSKLVATDAHIMAIWDSYYYWKSSGFNEVIGFDFLGNIEADPDGTKYSKFPDYKAIFPGSSESTKEYIFSDEAINILFYIAKLATVCKIKQPIIKIINSTFDIYKLTRLISFVRGVPGCNIFTLNIDIENYNRIAFSTSSAPLCSYLICPVYTNSDNSLNYFNLCDLSK
jgi:hypothetical protein